MPLGAPAAAAGSSLARPSVAPEAKGFTGAIGFHIERAGITQVARIEQDPINGFSPPIDRSLVVGKRLFTLSSDGVLASDLATLARLAFVAFPPPMPTTGGSGTAGARDRLSASAPTFVVCAAHAWACSQASR